MDSTRTLYGGQKHHRAREIAKCGHKVRLMPARYVKPYVKRNKNAAADAEAICEAVNTFEGEAFDTAVTAKF